MRSTGTIKGTFLVFMVVALYLIISGWASMKPVEPDVLLPLYAASEWGGHAAAVLAFLYSHHLLLGGTELI